MLPEYMKYSTYRRSTLGVQTSAKPDHAMIDTFAVESNVCTLSAKKEEYAKKKGQRRLNKLNYQAVISFNPRSLTFPQKIVPIKNQKIIKEKGGKNAHQRHQNDYSRDDSLNLSQKSLTLEINQESKALKTIKYKIGKSRKNTNETSMSSIQQTEQKHSEAMFIKIESPFILPTVPNETVTEQTLQEKQYKSQTLIPQIGKLQEGGRLSSIPMKSVTRSSYNTEKEITVDISSDDTSSPASSTVSSVSTYSMYSHVTAVSQDVNRDIRPLRREKNFLRSDSFQSREKRKGSLLALLPRERSSQRNMDYFKSSKRHKKLHNDRNSSKKKDKVATEAFRALDRNNLLQLQQILKKYVGFSVNSSDQFGSTLLSRAAQNGYLDAVQFLIKKGADLNIPDNDGNTPLHYAGAYQHHQIFDRLIEKGANQRFKNKANKTPWQGI